MSNIAKSVGGGGGQQRESWLDLARALAIISVTFNHALSRSFYTREGSQSEFLIMSVPGSIIKASLYVFSRLGVPLFLMITGALLLKRDYEEREVLRRFYKHNCWELLRTTEIWLAIMFWIMQITGRSRWQSQGAAKVLIEMVSTFLLFMDQSAMGSMWYMPMVLCIYLMIPIVAVGLKRLGDGVFYPLFCIVLLSGYVVPNINTLLEAAEINRSLEFGINSADIFSTYFLYVLAGYWISQGKGKIGLPWLWFGFVVSFVGTVAFQFWIYSSPSDYYVRYADIGILLTGVFLFEIIRRYAESIKTGAKAITYLSQISFGIYFVHICIMTAVNAILSRRTNLWMYPRFLILEFTSLLGSILIIWLTSKNKFFSRYLYLIKE